MQCNFSEGPKNFVLVNFQWLPISHQLCYHSVRISLSFEPLNPGTDFSPVATKALTVTKTSGLPQPPATDTKSLSQRLWVTYCSFYIRLCFLTPHWDITKLISALESYKPIILYFGLFLQPLTSLTSLVGGS